MDSVSLRGGSQLRDIALRFGLELHTGVWWPNKCFCCKSEAEMLAKRLEYAERIKPTSGNADEDANGKSGGERP